MTPQQLQKELQQAVLRPNGKPRRAMVVSDAIRRIETYLYRRRLNYRYGVIVRGRRIFLADMRTQKLLNEIGLDLAVGYESNKSFVYNIIVLGIHGGAALPIETNRGGAYHANHSRHTERRQQTDRALVR